MISNTLISSSSSSQRAKDAMKKTGTSRRVSRQEAIQHVREYEERFHDKGSVSPEKSSHRRVQSERRSKSPCSSKDSPQLHRRRPESVDSHNRVFDRREEPLFIPYDGRSAPKSSSMEKIETRRRGQSMVIPSATSGKSLNTSFDDMELPKMKKNDKKKRHDKKSVSHPIVASNEKDTTNNERPCNIGNALWSAFNIIGNVTEDHHKSKPGKSDATIQSKSSRKNSNCNAPLVDNSITTDTVQNLTRRSTPSFPERSSPHDLEDAFNEETSSGDEETKKLIETRTKLPSFVIDDYDDCLSKAAVVDINENYILYSQQPKENLDNSTDLSMESMKRQPVENIQSHETEVDYMPNVKKEMDEILSVLNNVANGCSVSGDGLKEGLVDQPNIFFIETETELHLDNLSIDIKAHGSDEIRLETTLIDANSCQVTYWPKRVGYYTISIQLKGLHVIGSPYQAKMLMDHENVWVKRETTI